MSANPPAYLQVWIFYCQVLILTFLLEMQFLHGGLKEGIKQG